MSVISPSRLGLNIGAYDQVIALSQDNINESLQYHFNTHKQLKEFNHGLKTASKDTIRGKISAPQIALIDEENADQAFYCLVFIDGTYTYWAEPTTDPDAPVDPDTPPGAIPWKQESIPLKGWKLAFYVDFVLKKMATVPEDIKKQINLPGSYGVNQLLINFGTADLMTFNWDRSVITGFDNKITEKAARDKIALFVANWLAKVKKEGNPNALGYAVTVDPAKTVNPKSDPSFPPTAVRLQTISFRPDGRRDNASPSDGRNAFLFTEVTGNEGPPSVETDDKSSPADRRLAAIPELAWTGDFFYDSIGGTLVMSRRIFWDKFLKEKLRPMNKDVVNRLNNLASVLVGPQLSTHATWWLSETNNVGEGQWTLTHGLDEKYKWQGKRDFNIDREPANFEYSTDTTVIHWLRPEAGTGKIHVDHDVVFKTSLSISLSGILKSAAKLTYKTTSVCNGRTTITLAAVDRIGGLSAATTKWGPEPTVTVETESSGIAMQVLDAVPGVGDMYRNDMTKLKSDIKLAMQSGVSTIPTTAQTIQDALNTQKQFVFPGGGTFDMKSPIFSYKGDLLVGLSYRKGESA